MDVFDSITNILSLLFGGSVISIVTWRYARRKAEAEAKQAEAEAKKGDQDYYQQMIDDVAKDRDYYKKEPSWSPSPCSKKRCIRQRYAPIWRVRQVRTLYYYARTTTAVRR